MPPFPRASTPDPEPRDKSGQTANEKGPDAGITPGAFQDRPAASAPDPSTTADAAEPRGPDAHIVSHHSDDPTAAMSENDSRLHAHEDGSTDDEADAFADTDPLHDADADLLAEDSPGDIEEDLDEDALDDSDEPLSFRSTVSNELARRAELSVLKGMENVADTFEETARRISRLARMRGGPEALTIGPVHSTVGWLEGAADYLRASDLEAVQSDLRHRVRARPVQSLGIALCAGWVIGRILR
jgi:hypothetical protein